MAEKRRSGLSLYFQMFDRAFVRIIFVHFSCVILVEMTYNYQSYNEANVSTRGIMIDLVTSRRLRLKLMVVMDQPSPQPASSSNISRFTKSSSMTQFNFTFICFPTVNSIILSVGWSKYGRDVPFASVDPNITNHTTVEHDAG
jgi:hypothetical protein